MPATFEAVRSALEAFAEAAPAWVPGSHTDVGGGTGAAAWAVSATWGGKRPVTVLDWAEPALALGREIAAADPALRDVRWQRSRIGAALTLESTDLVTVSYVLNELTAPDRTALVDAAATAAQAVVIVEPGTPDGYARVIRPATGWSTPASTSPPPARTAPPAPSPRARTGATSPPGSAVPPCTARSRAAPSPTRTRSSATSPPPASPSPRQPPVSSGARRSARARSSSTCARPNRPCTAPPSPNATAISTRRHGTRTGATPGRRHHDRDSCQVRIRSTPRPRA